jgi:hypothetical protein
MKKVMTNKIRKILGRLKLGLRPHKVGWVIEEKWSAFTAKFKLCLTFYIFYIEES